MAGGLELGDLYGPFQPLPFYDSMIVSLHPGFLNVLKEMKAVFIWLVRISSF